MSNCFVRIAESQKTGKRFICLVVKYHNAEKELFVFANTVDYMRLLDKSPDSLYTLPYGDYDIK